MSEQLALIEDKSGWEKYQEAKAAFLARQQEKEGK